jgi:streptogramin lyase
MRIIIALFFLPFLCCSQAGMGQWRLHMPNSKAIDIAEGEGKVFIAFEKGVAEYDILSNEISVWDVVNGLSDINVSSIYFSDSEEALFIGYENGNIDKLKNNGVTNIPAIELAQIQGSKKIYNIKEHNDFLYFATGFSIVEIDPSKEEVKNTWYPTDGNTPIVDLAFMHDSVYALTEGKLLRGNLNSVLADVNQWDVDGRVPSLLSLQYSNIVNFSNQLFILKNDPVYGSDTVYTIQNDLFTFFSNLGIDVEINSICETNGHLALNIDGASYLYDMNLSLAETYSAFNLGSWVSPNSVLLKGTELWMADKLNGVFRANSPFSLDRINISGPPRNSFFKMDWSRGKLAVAGGGLNDTYFTFNQSGVYSFLEEEWKHYDVTSQSSWAGKDVWDFISVSINPTNPDEIAAGSYSNIPLSIIDEANEIIDTLTPFNSLIEFSSVGNWSAVTDLSYDNSGNLWVLNAYAQKPLKVLTKDNDWFEFNVGSGMGNKFTRKLTIDYDGNKWFSLRDGGLYGVDDNNTISNMADDRIVHLNTGETSGNLPSNNVTAIAVDFDNEIWIGTDNGFAVLYGTETALEGVPGEYNAQRIKLEFEGNVEYLLGATNITDIEVDGGNRKWFGTANSGIILLSADGQEIIQQFTMENSALISNSIMDLEIDHNTGELYIVTDQGLISYRSDATYEDPDYSSVTVFPNPVRPEFDGPITIQGIQYDSDVKITDVAGNLIYKTTSNGGTATWNGKTLDGMDVTTGVYLIWTAPNNGKKRFVGKVLVVN